MDSTADSLYHRGVSTRETPALLGLRHLALSVARDRFAATLRFYSEGLGMTIDWQPDDDNVYLTSGTDNLALHANDHDQVHAESAERAGHGSLDHLGFMTPDLAAVEAWHARLSAGAGDWSIEVLGHPRLHRDGSSSFYLIDPAGNRVQILFMPTITR